MLGCEKRCTILVWLVAVAIIKAPLSWGHSLKPRMITRNANGDSASQLSACINLVDSSHNTTSTQAHLTKQILLNATEEEVKCAASLGTDLNPRRCKDAIEQIPTDLHYLYIPARFSSCKLPFDCKTRHKPPALSPINNVFPASVLT